MLPNFQKKYNEELRILLCFISFQKVERVGATSSFFNQEERKIFAIKVHDVRIEKEVNAICLFYKS